MEVANKFSVESSSFVLFAVMVLGFSSSYLPFFVVSISVHPRGAADEGRWKSTLIQNCSRSPINLIHRVIWRVCYHSCASLYFLFPGTFAEYFLLLFLLLPLLLWQIIFLALFPPLVIRSGHIARAGGNTSLPVPTSLTLLMVIRIMSQSE